MNYTNWLAYASQLLSEQCANNPYLEAKFEANLLLQYVIQKSKAQIIAFAETELDEKILQKLTALLQRRLQGEPMAYILGEKEFWSLPLTVSSTTLIPRPDTEILVESAVKICKDLLAYNKKLRILDLGTGTGAIALALKSELVDNAEIIGVDLVPEAVELAIQNAQKNQLDVQFLQSHWFEKVGGKFDIIVSNPPYIDADDPHLAQGDVRFEPMSALVAEQQGYADLAHIIRQSPQYLNNNGWLLLEHGWTQGEKVRSIFAEFNWQQISTIKDYGDNERITLACYMAKQHGK